LLVEHLLLQEGLLFLEPRLLLLRQDLLLMLLLKQQIDLGGLWLRHWLLVRGRYVGWRRLLQ
jgi:hypothetical protein